MDVLIIGGTQFVGRHLVEASLDAGHNVTLFNRGRTDPGIYPHVEEIHGDRDGGLEVLRGRKWDVVYDPSGYVPRIVRQSAEFLRDAVDRYIFVSTISVYSDINDLSETGPLLELANPASEDVLSDYGALKVVCEQIVAEIYGERTLNARLGFVVGQYDPITRLPYLLQRFDKGGEKIAATPDQPIQFIHARDAADWMLGAVEQKLSGDFNLTGTPFPMHELLDTIVEVTGKPTTITYVGDAFLKEQGIGGVDGLTYWVPKESQAAMNVSVQRALDTGLTFTPLKTTIEQTLDWVRSGIYKPDMFSEVLKQFVLTQEREDELLALWHQRQS